MKKSKNSSRTILLSFSFAFILFTSLINAQRFSLELSDGSERKCKGFKCGKVGGLDVGTTYDSQGNQTCCDGAGSGNKSM